MRVEKTHTDVAWHPERRRVKYFPVSATKDPAGHAVVIDNSDWVGDYPILWSHDVADGQKLIVMLIDVQTGDTAHALIARADFDKLPETDIEW
jgi:hypothetical protein